MVSSLLFGEDNNIFDDKDYGVMKELEVTWHYFLGHRYHDQDPSFGGDSGSDKH